MTALKSISTVSILLLLTLLVQSELLSAVAPSSSNPRLTTNNGSTFTDSGQNLGSGNSRDVALGDLDGDGDLDAFVANHDVDSVVWVNQGGAQGGTAGVFLNSGQALDSGFATAVALGDLDGDDDLDAFVPNTGGAYKIWLNQGGSQGGTEGHFLHNGQTLGDINATDVALGDLDGDSDLDAFVTRFLFPNKVWLNDGSGQFSDSGQGLGDENSNGVALADVDGDMDLDAFIANQGSDQVWLNDGAGAFSDSGQSLVSGTTSNAVVMSDTAGDGGQDAFVAHTGLDTLWINQSGVFSDSGQILDGNLSFDLALDDVDADGDLDAFVANFGGNTVWINQGGGQGGQPGVFFDSGQSLGSANSEGVALGDVDGDADVDAFVANNNGPNKIWLNQAVDTPVGAEVWQIQVVDGRSSTGQFSSIDLDTRGFPHILYVEHLPVESGEDYLLKYARWDGVQWHTEVVDRAPFMGERPAYTSLRLDSDGRPHVAYSTGDFGSSFYLNYAFWNGTAWVKQRVDGGREVVSMVLDSNSYPHIAYISASSAFIIKYAYWDGAQWQIETVNSNHVKGFVSLVLDEEDKPHISFVDTSYDILNYAHNSGSGWQTQVVDDFNSALGTNPYTAIAVDESGTPHIAYNWGGSLSNSVKYARWDGKSWQIETAVPPTSVRIQQKLSMSLDSSGNPHITYTHDGLSPGISLMHTYWDGSSWQTEILDSQTGKENAMVLDTNDRPHVSYFDPLYGDLRYVTKAVNWQTQTVTETGTLSGLSFEMWNSVPFLSYHNQASGQLKHTHWVGGWYLEPLEFVSKPVHHTATAVGFTRQHVSYYDADNQRLMYMVGDGQSWQQQIVDETGNVGQYNDLVLLGNSDHLVHIVYWEATFNRIKLAILETNNPLPQLYINLVGPPLNAESSPLSASLLPERDVGISYYDGINGNLRYAVWDSEMGTWTDELVDGIMTDVGRLNAIQTDGTDGLPVIAYYDETNEAIQFAYREGSSWQIETAASDISAPTSLSMELAFNSRLHARLAFTDAADDSLHLAALRDGVWEVELVETGASAALTDVSLSLENRPYLAYLHANNGLQFAVRSSTLDIGLSAMPTLLPPADPYYNPLDACQAVLDHFTGGPIKPFDASNPLQATSLPFGPPLGPDDSLSDLAIFNAIAAVFRASAGGQHYIDLYRQHGSEMGQLGLGDPQLLGDAYGTLQNFLPGLEALVMGNGDEILITQEMVDDALDIWQRLAAAGSPELANIINSELAQYNNLQDFVGMSFDEWAIALGVDPPPEKLYLPLVTNGVTAVP